MVNDADIICRCCGQVTENLKNMDEHLLTKSNLKLIEWFLMFTNFDKNTFCKKYTKICEICEFKLRQAHEFHELCLMGELIYLGEPNHTATGDSYYLDNDNSSIDTDYEMMKLEKIYSSPASPVHNNENDTRHDATASLEKTRLV
jgi:hypothetical protein